MKHIHILLFITCVLINFSCDDAEELSVQELITKFNHLPQIAILGSVSSEYKYHFVELQKPGNFNTGEAAQAITNAQVYLKIGDSIYEYIPYIVHRDSLSQSTTEHEDIFYKGRYVSRHKYKGIPGEFHTLVVKHNDKTYIASDFMPPALPTDIYTLFEAYSILESIGERDCTPGSSGRMVDGVMIEGCLDYHEQLTFPKFSFKHQESYFTTITYIPSNKNAFPIDTNYSSSIVGRGLAFFFNFIESPARMIPKYTTIGLNTESDTSLIIFEKISMSHDFQTYYLQTYFQENQSILQEMPANSISNISEGGIGFFSAHDVFQISTNFSELKTIFEARNTKQ